MDMKGVESSELQTLSPNEDNGLTGAVQPQRIHNLEITPTIVNDQNGNNPQPTDEVRAKQFGICRLNKPLIPLKCSIFFWYGGMWSSLPFVTVFLKRKGFSVGELSVLYGISSVLAIIYQVIISIVAEKTGRYKLLSLVNSLIFIISMDGMLLFPYNKSTVNVVHIRHQNNESGLLFNATCFGLGTDFCSNNCSILQLENNSIQYICYNAAEIGSVIFDANVDDVENGTLEKFNFSCHESPTINSTLLSSSCTKDASFNHSRSHNFWYEVAPVALLAVIFFATISSGNRIYDIISMSVVKTYNSDYGVARLWALLGSLCISAFTGYLIDKCSSSNEPSYVEISFYLCNCHIMSAILGLWKIRLSPIPPSVRMWKKTVVMLKNIDVIVLAAFMLVSGSCVCCIIYMLPYYLDDLGASATLQSMQIAVFHLSGLPVLFTSKWWMRKIGSTNVFVIALIGHSVRFVGLSYLTDPWWVLACQTVSMFTYHLLWVAVVTHVYEISPVGLKATMVILAGVIHIGAGKIVGTSVIGSLKTMLGWRVTFRILSAITFCIAMMYALFLHKRKHRQHRGVSEKRADVLLDDNA